VHNKHAMCSSQAPTLSFGLTLRCRLGQDCAITAIPPISNPPDKPFNKGLSPPYHQPPPLPLTANW
jgi:hypothetical protein